MIAHEFGELLALIVYDTVCEIFPVGLERDAFILHPIDVRAGDVLFRRKSVQSAAFVPSEREDVFFTWLFGSADGKVKF